MIKALVVFPVPGLPENIMWGMFFCLTNASSRLSMFSCPMNSWKFFGLCLLIQIECSPDIIHFYGRNFKSLCFSYIIFVIAIF